MPNDKNHIFDYLIDNYRILLEAQGLDKNDIENLKIINNNIKSKFLYSFVYHGLHHSQKVMIFAYLIGKKEKLSADDMRILIDAAIYHDVGRIDESEDTLHGYSSTIKYDQIFNNDFYKNKTNMSLIKAITEGHSRPDQYKVDTFNNYDLDYDTDFKRYEKLYNILKDADALDRARFSKTSSESIKEEFLRSDYSKSLVDLAFFVNRIYGDTIDNINFYQYYNLYSNFEKKNACLHGIGWDFSKLESILQYGILSSYAAQMENVNMSRNYNGNNSNMWISTVDSRDVNKENDAYKKFIDNNIVIYAFVGGYHKGISVASEALSTGQPIKTSLYEDESFVFYKIDPQDIYGFILPKNSYHKSLKDLNYLDCSVSHQVIESRIKSYYDYISNICGICGDFKSVEPLIGKLRETEIYFGKLPEYEQRQKLHSFFSNIDYMAGCLNNIVANFINDSFRSYFNLNDGEDATIGMVVEDILRRNNINHQIMNSEETIIKVDIENKKKTN